MLFTYIGISLIDYFQNEPIRPNKGDCNDCYEQPLYLPRRSIEAHVL
ncbi:hypothetical protein NELLIE_57 [Arthrobacter phage Nellie]|uniref:Uncharacterized protein n=1 Tax=Arthrobacter phage Nellie TaxID=2027886 RepID=A0A249XPU7_9CAUD|nr:hypothetical protein NELLIE_57 [Arthrobacter phage Nellie]